MPEHIRSFGKQMILSTTLGFSYDSLPSPVAGGISNL